MKFWKRIMPGSVAALAGALALFAAAPAQAVFNCPSDMKRIGASGSAKSFCIDRQRSGAPVSYAGALDACTSQGKMLCNLNEWHFMCYKVTTPSDPTPDPTLMINGESGGVEEWVDTPAPTASIRFSDLISKRFTVGATSCSSSNAQTVSTPTNYRCCIR